MAPILLRETRNTSILRQPLVRNDAYRIFRNSIGTGYRYFLNQVQNSNRNYFIWNNNTKQVLGAAFVYLPKNKGMVQLSLIGTKKGQGYGKQIMNAIYNNAKKEGYKGVKATNVVLQAEGFYQKMGLKYNGLHSYSWSRQRTPSPNRKRKRNNNNNSNNLRG